MGGCCSESVGDSCHSPVFICGCGHSGTTLLFRILRQVPELHGITKETYVFFKGDKNCRKLLEQLELEAGEKRLLEKTPKHVRWLSKLFLIRPDAQVIVIVRDARAVCASLKRRFGNLQDAIERWVLDTTHSLGFINDPRVLHIRYEDLVQKPKSTLKRAAKFLRLPRNPALHKLTGPSSCEKIAWNGVECPNEPPKTALNGSPHEKLRSWQFNNEDMHTRSLSRWQTELSTPEVDLINRQCSGNMQLLGY